MKETKTGIDKIGGVKIGVTIEEDVNLMVKMEEKIEMTGEEAPIKLVVNIVVEITVKLNGMA